MCLKLTVDKRSINDLNEIRIACIGNSKQFCKGAVVKVSERASNVNKDWSINFVMSSELEIIQHAFETKIFDKLKPWNVSHCKIRPFNAWKLESYDDSLVLITCVVITNRIALILIERFHVVAILLVSRNHKFCHVFLRVGEARCSQAELLLDCRLDELTHLVFRQFVFAGWRRQIHSLCSQFNERCF